MGYQKKRVDSNQPQIVGALRSVSASVAHTHVIGKGFPDIVVGVEGIAVIGNKQKVLEVLKDIPGIKIIEGVNLLVEIKDGTKSASATKLTPDEEEWHAKWQGQICIIGSEEEAIALVKPLQELELLKPEKSSKKKSKKT